ncbi:hypothetical protein OEB99_15245 [Actinotalea sp. M2MS4P-6]|uniref:hypothetical protein n=1 Tax=Actinotalea sp. M2MS4P-6 TaxID=2983762 RepID=UPI0021E41A1F|nr:hypothetical protein [Actinotalea sp. M2MS4P-6]MCV2395669.1 hypothetical protein [Actinotalea sp. M2MS4P-6]
MRARTKIGAGLAAGAVVIAGVLGTASAAAADTTADDDTTAWCGASLGAGVGAGMRGGWASADGTTGRYGASAVADYLAEKLGVAADDVTAALVAFHAENPVTVRGRDLTDDALAERQAAEAASLADALGVDEADVLAALQSFDDDRQAERTAALEDLLAERVAAGTLTQSEADAILAAHQAGDPIGLGGQRMGGMRGTGGFGGGHGRGTMP